MRTLAVAALTGLVALVVAGSASAAPSFSVLFSGTTGTGTIGSNTIDATAGDTVTVDVILTPVDAANTSGWDFDLLGTGVTGVSGQECPGGVSTVGGTSNNVGGPGTCFTSLFGSITPIQAGVLVNGSNVENFDAGALSPVNLTGVLPLFIGQAVFTVGGSGSIDLVGLFGYGDFSQIAVNASATIVPEPGTMGLMGLGMAALGLAGRRRK